MATIGNIRKRSGLVLTLIGVAILLFLLSDNLNQNMSLFGDKIETSVGVVAGEEVDAKYFESLRDRFMQNAKNQQNTSELTATQTMQVNNQTWETIVQEKILEKEFDDLGVTVSEEEISDAAFGNEPHAYLTQIGAFQNEEQKYDKDKLRSFINGFDEVPPESQLIWTNLVRDMKLDIQRNKYFSMISKGMYVSELEAKDDYFGKNQTGNIKFVRLKTSDLSDSTYAASDEEIKQYAIENDMVYENDERTINYVSFNIEPNAKDSAFAKSEAQRLAAEFETSQNPGAFARINSDGQVAEDKFYEISELKTSGLVPADMLEDIFSAEIGTVFGPINQFGAYTVIKVIDEEENELTSYRAAHILKKPEESDEPSDADTTAAMKEARALLPQLRDGDFAEIAKKESDGPSAANGGDLDWWQTGRMVPAFQNAVESMEKGELKVVKSRFGAHVIKMTHDPIKVKRKIAIIEKKVVPSQETERAAYAKAAEFWDKARTAQAFVDATIDMDLNVGIAENLKSSDVSIPGLGEARTVVQWAYRQKSVDAISDIMTLPDRYLVALVTEIRVKGDLHITGNETDISQKIIRKKKLADLENKMAGAYTDNLETIASNLGVEVETAENVGFSSPIIPQLGNEPKVTGAVFSLNDGEVSDVIVGSEGVYVIQTEGFSEVEEPESYADYKTNLQSSRSAGSQFNVLNALKKKANVVDKRYNFY